MTSYKLVMPGDLNHYGFLFGGKMLMWVDEIAWMAVSGDYPGQHFVTSAALVAPCARSPPRCLVAGFLSLGGQVFAFAETPDAGQS